MINVGFESFISLFEHVCQVGFNSEVIFALIPDTFDLLVELLIELISISIGEDQSLESLWVASWLNAVL